MPADVSPSKFKRAGVDSAPAVRFFHTWIGRILLVLLSVLLLTLSFAPLNVWPLAYVACVPWLLLIYHLRGNLTAFLYGWLTGALLFLANMYWLWKVTVPGLFGLVIYLGLYFGILAVLLRWVVGWRARAVAVAPAANQSRDPSVTPQDVSRATTATGTLARVVGVAVVFTAVEWLRGHYSVLGNEGLPWLYLGHSQSLFLSICQIADITGVAGITFLLVMVNAWAASFVINGLRLRPVLPTAVVVLLALCAAALYGRQRMLDKSSLSTGPTVLLVQANFPQDNSGAKGATQRQIDRFHIQTTTDALARLNAANQRVDLVVWSETMMDALNREARDFIWNLNQKKGQELQDTFDAIGKIAATFRVNLLTGGVRMTDWREKPDADGSTFFYAADRRNVAYYFSNIGFFSDDRYDKIKLVPFGEFMPFQHTIPPLYRLMMTFNPYSDEYTLTRGDNDALTRFPLERMPQPSTIPATSGQPIQNGVVPRTWQFVTPICFEDLDATLVARMFRSTETGKKSADLLVNITNDGWFGSTQPPAHLQAAIFRSIENRVPTARSVNTGISAFVDSCGRVIETIPPGIEGTSVATVTVDDRHTFFTRFGEMFSHVCAAITSILLIGRAIGLAMRKRPIAQSSKL